MDDAVTVRALTDAECDACEEILRALPEWFGLDEANEQHARDIRRFETLGAWHGNGLVGFVTIRPHFEHSAEIQVMGVRVASHRRGVGTALLAAAERSLRERGERWLQVKTLGPSRENEPYERTRAFYRARGFEPLEELATLWDANNPCLLMVKRL